MQPVKPGTKWKYVGPLTGQGSIHTVIFADASIDEIVTIAINCSWLGDIELFNQHFNPA